MDNTLKFVQVPHRYYIAIIPPPHILSYVNEIREYIGEKYNTRAALNQPPHITLIPPFEIEGDKYDLLITELLTYVNSITSTLSIKVRDYGSFPSSTLFLNVEPNEDLNNLVNDLSKALEDADLIKAPELEYHPHMTVAFKDLTEDNYLLAWEEYRDKRIYLEWESTSISLLKYEDKRWITTEELLFSNV